MSTLKQRELIRAARDFDRRLDVATDAMMTALFIGGWTAALVAVGLWFVRSGGTLWIS